VSKLVLIEGRRTNTDGKRVDEFIAGAKKICPQNFFLMTFLIFGQQSPCFAKLKNYEK
jgi:hypothetical protein